MYHGQNVTASRDGTPVAHWECDGMAIDDPLGPGRWRTRDGEWMPRVSVEEALAACLHDAIERFGVARPTALPGTTLSVRPVDPFPTHPSALSPRLDGTFCADTGTWHWVVAWDDVDDEGDSQTHTFESDDWDPALVVYSREAGVPH